MFMLRVGCRMCCFKLFSWMKSQSLFPGARDVVVSQLMPGRLKSPIIMVSLSSISSSSVVYSLSSSWAGFLEPLYTRAILSSLVPFRVEGLILAVISSMVGVASLGFAVECSSFLMYNMEPPPLPLGVGLST